MHNLSNINEKSIRLIIHGAAFWGNFAGQLFWACCLGTFPLRMCNTFLSGYFTSVVGPVSHLVARWQQHCSNSCPVYHQHYCMCKVGHCHANKQKLHAIRMIPYLTVLWKVSSKAFKAENDSNSDGLMLRNIKCESCEKTLSIWIHRVGGLRDRNVFICLFFSEIVHICITSSTSCLFLMLKVCQEVSAERWRSNIIIHGCGEEI